MKKIKILVYILGVSLLCSIGLNFLLYKNLHSIKKYEIAEGEVLTYSKYNFPIVSIKENDQFISKSIQLKGTWQPEIVKVLERFVRPGSQVLHLGANIGFDDIILGKIVGDKGKVFAFEPNPEVLGILNKNIILNNLNNIVQIFPYATGDENGFSKICSRPSSKNVGGALIIDSKDGVVETPDQTCYKTKIIRLDSLSLPKIDFIFMDIEGYELKSLKGAKKLLEQSSYPPILMEWCPLLIKNTSSEIEAFLEEFQKKGYRFYKLFVNKRHHFFWKEYKLVKASLLELSQEKGLIDIYLSRDLKEDVIIL